MAEKVKIACYCRVSTKNESQQSSIENQEKFFLEFIARNPQYELYRLYTDEGISAKNIQKRKAFLEMIQDAKKGYFNKILVKDVSRFARNVVDLLETIRELRRHHITVEFITYNMETMGNSEFVLTVLAAIAQEESHNTSVKVKFGKKMAAKNGAVPSIIYGYDHNKEKGTSLEINRMEAAVVERIFKLYTEKQFGPQKIAKILTEEKIPTKYHSEKGWTPETINRILKNKIYIGQVCNGKTESQDYLTGTWKKKTEKEWIIVEKKELRIISDVLFEKAVDIRKARGKEGKKQANICPSICYPLSNLIYCGNDGSAFRRKTKKGTSYIYWTCNKRDKMGKQFCSNQIFIKESEMEYFLLQFLKDFMEEQIGLEKMFQNKLKKRWQEKEHDKKNKIDMMTEKTSLISQRKKLMDLYLSDKIDQSYLEKEMVPIENRLKEILIVNQDERIVSRMKMELIQGNEKWKERMDNGSIDLLNNVFLKAIFENFFVYSNGMVEAAIKKFDKSQVGERIPFLQIKKDT